MSRAKKSFLSKFLWTIFSIIITISVAIGGTYFYAKSKLGIDLVSTIKSLKILSQDINKDDYFNNQFSDLDSSSLKDITNNCFPNLIKYSIEDGYSISAEDVPNNTQLLADQRYTDKQIGALINILLNSSEDNASIKIDDMNIAINLIQVQFSNVLQNTADVNVVVKIDISILKNKMVDFPLNILAKYIPNYIYISSVVSVEKQSGAFNYNVNHKEITLNALDKQQTSDILKILNSLLGTGSEEDLSLKIATPFINAFIGNSENSGFAYSLKDLGVDDYDFETENNINYFVLKYNA